MNSPVTFKPLWKNDIITCFNTNCFCGSYNRDIAFYNITMLFILIFPVKFTGFATPNRPIRVILKFLILFDSYINIDYPLWIYNSIYKKNYILYIKYLISIHVTNK